MKAYVQKLVNGFPILQGAFITKDYKTRYNLLKYSGVRSMEGDFCLTYLKEKIYAAPQKVEYYIKELGYERYMFVKIRFVGDNKFSIETIIRKELDRCVIVQENTINIDLEKLKNWSKVLRTAKQKQCVGRLSVKLKDGEEYFCSLGILGISCDETLFSKCQNNTALRGELLKKSLGMKTTTASEHFQNIFIYLNDIFGFTFTQIAYIIDLFVEAFETKDFQKISTFRFRGNEIIKY